MRRIAAFATALVLAVAVLTPADAASAKLGGPCKKLHQVDWIKNVRVQCTWIPAAQGKKGRAAWKALPLAKTTATAAELNLPVLAPTSFDDLLSKVSGIPSGAWQRASSTLAATTARSVPLTVLTGPTSAFTGFDPSPALSAVTRLFPAAPIPPRLLIVVHNGDDRAWATEVVRTEVGSADLEQLQRNEGGDITASNCRTTCDGAKQLMVHTGTSLLLIGRSALYGKVTSDQQALVAHEFTHSLQSYAFVDSGRSWSLLPRWLVEGGAEWTQLAATSADFDGYLGVRRGVLREFTPSSLSAAWLEDFLRSTDGNASYANWRLYDLGMLATEVLVSIAGPEALMRLFGEVAGGKDFPTAFSAIFGTPWDTAVPKIAAAIAASK